MTNSICSPSRATILTGKYSHKNGVHDNYTPFDGSQVTFPKLLQQAGYQTAFIGKWHLHTEPTGFDHWDKLPGQGKYYRPVFETSAGKRNVPGHVTDITTELAVEWLAEKRDPERPFLLMVHHKAPHSRWDPAPDKLGLYNGRIPEPATLFDDYAGRGTAARHAKMRIGRDLSPPSVKLWTDDNDGTARWLYGHMSPAEIAAWKSAYYAENEAFEENLPTGEALTRWKYQRYIQDYLRCVASVDDGVGKLLDYLDENELADNTLIAYTSDQGFYLGEHGWFDKRFMYEQSLRTPLVMRWPASIEPGRVEERIVSNVDLAETFLDAAGISIPTDMQGRSLLPLLHGESPDDWRQTFYYHYYEGVEKDHHVFKHEGVTNGRHKLIHYYPLGEWELFDLERDPDEMRSVYGQPKYADIQRSLKKELSRLRGVLEITDSG